MMNKKSWNDSGFTLVELLASSLIVLIAIAGLFVGIQFTENQVFKNYRTRKAMLLVSARLEYHNYFKQKYGGFKLNADDIPIYSQSYRLHSLSYSRNIVISFRTTIDSLDYNVYDNTYNRARVEVTGTWPEPSRNNKNHRVMLMEDYYAAKQ